MSRRPATPRGVTAFAYVCTRLAEAAAAVWAVQSDPAKLDVMQRNYVDCAEGLRGPVTLMGLGDNMSLPDASWHAS